MDRFLNPSKEHSLERFTYWNGRRIGICMSVTVSVWYSNTVCNPVCKHVSYVVCYSMYTVHGIHVSPAQHYNTNITFVISTVILWKATGSFRFKLLWWPFSVSTKTPLQKYFIKTICLAVISIFWLKNLIPINIWYSQNRTQQHMNLSNLQLQ